MEFFDEEKLITYSAVLPSQREEFLLDESLVLSAQEKIFSRNMAETNDLHGYEVINSIFSALVINRKNKSFKLGIKVSAIEDRKKKGLCKYAGFRLSSDNYQKLKDMMELIREVAPLPKPDKGVLPFMAPEKQSVRDEMSKAIDVVLNLFQLDGGEE